MKKTESSEDAEDSKIPDVNGQAITSAIREDEEEGQADGTACDPVKKKSKSKKKKEPLLQTDPPSIPINELFPSGEYPAGEIQQYKNERMMCRRVRPVSSSGSAKPLDARNTGM